MSPFDRILMGHGAGGRMTAELVRELFLEHIGNEYLEPLDDAAVLPPLPPGRPALTTDAFVVSPALFPGGNLGHLAVTGTVNDLSMSGARPLWITWGVILEEGVEAALVETCVRGAAEAAETAGVRLVAGDTKVVPRGAGDGIYAVTAGLGIVPPGRELGDTRLRPGDAIVLTGTLGDHGAAIMAARHGLGAGELLSDCAPLAAMIEALWEGGVHPRSMHDPTRGGLATVAVEVAVRSGLRMELDEPAIPVRRETRAVCEILGLDPLYLACEGRAVLWIAPDELEPCLDLLRQHPLGKEAAVIGQVGDAFGAGSPVVLRTRSGGLRPLDMLSGAGLPRIC